ncbi:MAG: hypothetical protein KGL39_39035 [Patescibacteria group bacterium]|nr:hypothetical protein [Patescibacteria group bacterium]
MDANNIYMKLAERLRDRALEAERRGDLKRAAWLRARALSLYRTATTPRERIE